MYEMTGKPEFLWDEPIKPGSAGKVDDIARSLAEAMPTRAIKGPVTMAIYGPWGSGKTTFLRCLQYCLENKNPDDVPGAPTYRPALTIWFEPWRYEREPDLIIPLLTELTTHLVADMKGRAVVKQAIMKTGLKLVGRVAKAAARTGAGFVASQVGLKGEDIEKIGQDFMSFYEGESDRYAYPKSENEAFKSDFIDLIRMAATGRKDGKIEDDNARPVAIFIDDLDRCSHKQVRRLLESMKNFLWAPGIIYLLAVDREQVTLALSDTYSKGGPDTSGDLLQARVHAKNYLEKFFLYAFDIGDGSPRFVDDVVGVAKSKFFDELKAAFPDSFFDDLKEASSNPNVVRDWEDYEAAYKHAELNLRRLKRIVRWLYYELKIEPLRSNLIAYFAEYIFSENYPMLWLDTFETRSLAMRSSAYSKIITTIGAFVPEMGDRINFSERIVTQLLRALREPDNEAALDADLLESIRAEITAVSRNQIGKMIAELIDGNDEVGLRRLRSLATYARNIHVKHLSDTVT